MTAPDEGFSPSRPGPKSSGGLRRPTTEEERLVPGSHAEDIVVDYFEGDNWDALDDTESEPELDLTPLPSTSPPPAAA